MRLIFIVLSQFLSGSIWFAGNVAFMGQGFLLSAVQLGFIIGTLGFAFLNISDRFSPARVFFLSAAMGSLFNTAGIFVGNSMGLVLASRVLCGISLAGIYPVGMKIAVSWYPKSVSRALGWMVGALVLASGFPYLILALSWKGDPGVILAATSLLCLSGGLIQLFLVGDGPYLPKSSPFSPGVVIDIFRHPEFRRSAFGYFGHMWELYAVYAYIPLMIEEIGSQHAELWSFGFFAAGFLGCAAGGVAALRIGSRRIAMAALAFSGTICVLSPLLPILPQDMAKAVVLIWGLSAAADSPQFSSLNTRFAPPNYVGSALTIVNCIGFLITIVTIELLDVWIRSLGIRTAFLILALGPLFGLVSLKSLQEEHPVA